MTWIYQQTERPSADNDWHSLYSVGFYDPDGKWHSDSDWTEREEAASRVHWLNGGNNNKKKK